MSTSPPMPRSVTWASTERALQFEAWLNQLQPAQGLHTATLRVASVDAGFRRYLRIDSDAGSRIIMDAPPDKEDCVPFVQVAALMREAGLRVPEVLAWHEAQGFMLLTDLGERTLLQSIDPAGPPPFDAYMLAVDALVQWQSASKPGVLPPYDAPLLNRELALFPDWYMTQHRQVTIDAAMRQTLDTAFACIVHENLAWPQVYVHRDFMPRNLMPAAGCAMGVLDFQDAVYGPITYDIASLLRDAFVSWDEAFCLDITVRYWERARKAGLPVGDDFGAFYRGVEWMGLQRHLKVAGIFARLALRDGKAQYLADAPRFIGYICATAARYRELKPLLRLVEKVEGVEIPNVFAFGRP